MPSCPYQNRPAQPPAASKTVRRMNEQPSQNHATSPGRVGSAVRSRGTCPRAVPPAGRAAAPGGRGAGGGGAGRGLQDAGRGGGTEARDDVAHHRLVGELEVVVEEEQDLALDGAG